MYYCQDANMYEKVTSVISWNCPPVTFSPYGAFFGLLPIPPPPTYENFCGHPCFYSKFVRQTQQIRTFLENAHTNNSN